MGEKRGTTRIIVERTGGANKYHNSCVRFVTKRLGTQLPAVPEELRPGVVPPLCIVVVHYYLHPLYLLGEHKSYLWLDTCETGV